MIKETIGWGIVSIVAPLLLVGDIELPHRKPDVLKGRSLDAACAIRVNRKLDGQLAFVDTNYIMGVWEHPNGHAIILLEGGYIVAITRPMSVFLEKLLSLPKYCRPGHIRSTK